MPLFMDRHDLPGATAEQVAQAHRSDLGLEAKYGVQFLSYWFDADNGEAFCLARARRTEDMQAVHRESHGLIANEVIGVSEDNVLRFLGKIADPVDPTQLTSAFRTILFDDVAHALECAAAIQDGFDARTAGGGTPELRVRIGMAAGEPVDHNDDVFGSTVNLASRICDAADAGQVLVSELVRDLGVKKGFSLVEAGERVLRGYPAPTRVFELLRTLA